MNAAGLLTPEQVLVPEPPPAQAPASPIRLLNVVPTLMCGGTENQVMALCRSLQAKHYEMEFACLRRIGPFIDEIGERQIPLSEYRIPSFYSFLSVIQQGKFGRHLSRQRIQIVHAYNFYGNVFAIPPARVAGVPVVIASIRDRGPYLSPLQRRVQRHVCRLAESVLVNADAVKDWLIADGYDPTKIVVIRNGVDLSRFRKPVQPGQISHALGLPHDTPLVAVVSRLNRLKGLEHFLEASALIAPRFPEARFLVVGETPPYDREYLGELTALAHTLGIGNQVIFTGLRSDVPALLAGVTVAVMPSLNEALSNALLESMAAGAPVVATDVGGTSEALIDGESGLLVSPGDAPALAAAIARLLDAPRLAARLGAGAREAIAQRFSLDRMVEATEQLYMELLARKDVPC